MCIACRDRASKRALTRIVRSPEGDINVDPTGKRNGRGAYLCSDRRCWERALATDLLARALKTEIQADAAERLRRHVATLPESTEPGGVASEEGTNHE
jgi:predicted RNA-binding protein YlxR (DUF448 family)